MPIYINARFLTHKITGVERFAIEISRELKKIRNDIVWVAPNKGLVLKDIADELGVKTFGRFSGHLWEQMELSRYLKKQGSPLLINLMNTAPVFYRNKISVIHDIAFCRYPETFSLAFRWFYQWIIPRVLETSRKIITVSEFSRGELVSFYKVNPSDIEVVYNAVSENFLSVSSVRPDKESFILAVGSVHPQKNLIVLLQAMKILGENYCLNVIGGKRSNFSENTQWEALLSDSVHFLGRISDEGLLSYYQKAWVLVFPSLYEGFGIPPLEAQCLGTPVILSDIPVLREVYGESALYFNPKNPEELADRIKRVYEDEKLYKDLSEKGKENCRNYTWKDSALKFSRLIDELS